MLYRHVFLHSSETDQNEPKHHYWVQKSGLGAFVSFSARIGALNSTQHSFLHSNETDQNEPKHHYWVQKSGLGAFVSFLARIGSSFCFRPNRCIKCYTDMVFCTVTKLTKTNENITIGSKKVDWLVRFVFGANR